MSLMPNENLRLRSDYPGDNKAIEIESLRQQLAESESERLEQARLLMDIWQQLAELAATANRWASAYAEKAAEAAHWKNNHETEVRRARILKERTDMPIERVQAYEKWGEDQRLLAESKAEILRLKADCQNVGEANEKLGARVIEAEKAAAASQAREQQLRNGLTWIATVNAMDYEYVEVARKSLDIAYDTAALEAVKAQVAHEAGEVMRERCAVECEQRQMAYATAGYERHAQATAGLSDDIRALPGVTLEDLWK